ncbi:MAG TPA: hypothetical protein VJL83_00910 [Patescibacteria group bacterium]|nr:hypothetical protein [Patescibacteria group bacterium]
MEISDPGFVFLGLVLPCLFSLTLIAEGMWKVSQRTSGWVNIFMGLGFISLTLWVYFYLLQ